MGVEKKAEHRLVGFGCAKARQAIFFDEPKGAVLKVEIFEIKGSLFYV